MSRRNISITNPDVEVALERADNVSKFIERCVLEHLEREKVEYATMEDLQEQQKQIKILNQNYVQMKSILEEIAETIFKN